MRNRHFRLSEDPAPRTLRLLASIATLPAEGKNTSWETVSRTGSFTDPRYGRFEITREMLLSMVRNFEARTVGIDIFFDVSHKPEDGAAAKILKLAVEGNRLRAQVEWTPYGIDAVEKKGYRYLSAEFIENYQDNEKGEMHGPTLLGAGLTVRPVIKNLDPVTGPVTLSCESDDDIPFLIHTEFSKTLLSEVQTMWKQILEALRAQLAAKNLSEAAVSHVVMLAEKALAHVADESAAKALCAQFEGAALQLAQAVGSGAPIQLSMTGMNAEQVQAQITKALADQATAAKTLAETTDARRKLLADTIGAAQGIDDATKKELTESAAKLVTGDMTEDQVKALAQMQINAGNQIANAVKLAMLGYHSPSGTPRIFVPDEGAKKLSQIYHDNLKLTNSYANKGIKLSSNASVFLSKVLSEFDRINGPQIDQEAKMLSGGQTTMGNVSLPAGFQREVLREALSDLRILELIQTLTDFGAQATTLIPYEYRDVSQIGNNGIVYEGQEISYATMRQANDTAHLNPTKVAYIVSNEVAHFSRTSVMNWDATARSIATCSQIVRELICIRLANELQRAADTYGAIAVDAEDFKPQLDGAKFVIKTANFPIVRQHQARDMEGNAVSVAENPIIVVLNGNEIAAYNGTGEQSVGTYYQVINYNMGYVQFVNQAGEPVAPANTGVNTISYSRATNIVKADLDLPDGVENGKHLNSVLEKIGSQKAIMSGHRFITPNFLLMSPLLNDTLSNADQFINELKRNGSDTSASGDLLTVKSIPTFGTNAPGIDLGDQRIIMGQRGTTTYTIAKPFELGEPFEAVGKNGRPIGKRQAYGEEYSATHTPKPIRKQLTSILVYSAKNR